MSDPIKPSVALLSKLGSIVVHLDEALSTDGHYFDKVSLEQLQQDAEVKEWVKQMDGMALIPKKRNE
jgi:hypothetical protein